MNDKQSTSSKALLMGGCLVALLWSGCNTPPPAPLPPERPNVAPQSPRAAEIRLPLDASLIRPMVQELLSIDLSTAIRIAQADNLDILQSQRQTDIARAQLRGARAAVLPRLVPSLLFRDVEGTVQGTRGNLVEVGFSTFEPTLALQWIINPGKVYYDILAAKKQLLGSEHREQAVLVETLRQTALQYYELALAQAEIAAAHQAVLEAEELVRINQLRQQVGTGIAADLSLAQAHLAERQQNQARALNAFYHRSIELSLTLRLDASVTLVPAAEHLMPIDLVREEFDFDALMAMAIRFRPDLEQVRVLVEEIAARTDASRWGELGPFFGLAYQIGAIGADEGEGLSSLEGQQRFSAGVGADWSFAAFANLEAAQAFEQQVILEADRKLDEVKAEVASALADATLYRALLSQSKARLSAAEEAARLVQSSFSTGTVTLLDVLQAQEALSRARLEHAEIVVHYNTTQVELLAALGMIDGDRLALTSVISDQ